MRGLRRSGTVALVAAALALLGGLGGRPGTGSSAAASELHHAAVVIDTGDGGTVRKFCLAFPEDSITGAEALRRIESDAVFASYGGKGQAVCALCGVGCPSGDCFCDRSKYWGYFRAGPGGEPYTFSRAGVSATTVRDGDVEGWRWGTGDPPPAATVGEVCDVPEPPVRSASASGPTTTPAPAPAPSTTTTAATPGADPPAPPTTTAVSAAAPRAASQSITTTTVGVANAGGPEAGATTTTSEATEVTRPEGDESAAPTVPARSIGPRRDRSGGDAPGGVAGFVAFGLLLGGVLVGRWRLKRPDVRPVRGVR